MMVIQVCRLYCKEKNDNGMNCSPAASAISLSSRMWMDSITFPVLITRCKQRRRANGGKRNFLVDGRATCPFAKTCTLDERKEMRVYYFTDEEYRKKKRLKNIENIPIEQRSIRANVEATVCEFSRKMRSGKVRVRGAFRTMVFAFSMAVSISFGRIFRYLKVGTDEESYFFFSSRDHESSAYTFFYDAL